MVDGGTTTSGSGASSPALSTTTSETETLVFNRDQCLFCNKLHHTFEANMAHMRLAHGLMIPAKDRLVVDFETLFSYLHLVISGYNECLCCGTQRSTTEAVQQHMMDKSHCRFDIEAEGSEYADFYDSSPSETDSDVEGDDRKMETVAANPDENWLRLPSGRIIYNRAQSSANSAHPRRTRSRYSDNPELLEGGPNDQNAQASAPRESTGSSRETASADAVALSRADRRVDTMAKRFANLRTGDQLALANLAPSERRAVVAMQQREVERSDRVENRYRLRVEGLGNMFLMTHFRKDAADKRTLYR